MHHEKEKKRAYNDRIIEVDRGSFTPLVFSTSGGEGPECKIFHKRLATSLSIKRNESYSDTISFIRRKLRFCILRTTLIAVRGYRPSKRTGNYHREDVNDYNIAGLYHRRDPD